MRIFKLWCVAFSSLLLLSIVGTVSGTCSNPPPQKTGDYGWARSAVPTHIRYFIDNRANTFTSAERTEIEQAFASWSSASLETCIKVQFDESTTLAGSRVAVLYNYSYTSTTATIRYPDPITHIIPSAIINIVMADFDPSNTTTFPGIIKKTVLHEIGHTMGLDHYTGTSGNSVMNIYDPSTNMNDAAGYHPTSVQECDVDAINLHNPQCQTENDDPCPFPFPTTGSCPSGSSADPDHSGYCCPDSGTCNGIADFSTYPTTGCSSGFVANGDYCERSSDFQESCADPDDYDFGSCSCPDGTIYDTPTPTPTPD